MTFIKTILIILLVYYGLKILFQFAKPCLMKYITKKAGQRFEQSFGGNPFQQPKQKKEGEVSIDKAPLKNKTSNNSVGDYVDFEEIE